MLNEDLRRYRSIRGWLALGTLLYLPAISLLIGKSSGFFSSWNSRTALYFIWVLVFTPISMLVVVGVFHACGPLLEFFDLLRRKYAIRIQRTPYESPRLSTTARSGWKSRIEKLLIPDSEQLPPPPAYRWQATKVPIDRALLLRPFILDRIPGAQFGEAISFEELLCQRVSVPIMVVGSPLEIMKSIDNRIYLGSDWKGEIRDVWRSSCVIIAILSESENVLWEMNEVTGDSQNTSPLVVVFPPNIRAPIVKKRFESLPRAKVILGALATAEIAIRHVAGLIYEDGEILVAIRGSRLYRFLDVNSGRLNSHLHMKCSRIARRVCFQAINSFNRRRNRYTSELHSKFYRDSRHGSIKRFLTSVVVIYFVSYVVWAFLDVYRDLAT